MKRFKPNDSVSLFDENITFKPPRHQSLMRGIGTTVGIGAFMLSTFSSPVMVALSCAVPALLGYITYKTNCPHEEYVSLKQRVFPEKKRENKDEKLFGYFMTAMFCCGGASIASKLLYKYGIFHENKELMDKILSSGDFLLGLAFFYNLSQMASYKNENQALRAALPLTKDKE